MDSLRFHVPQHAIKYIIGTGGSTLKSLQQTHQVTIKVDNDGEVVMQGSQHNMQRAHDAITRLLHDNAFKGLNSNSAAVSRAYNIPSAAHKHIIGTGGSHINEIQKQCGVKIELSNDDKVTVFAQDGASVDAAFSEICKVLAEFNWKYDGKRFAEDNVIAEFADKARAAANREAEKRNELFEASKKAFTSGDKAKAKTLSEQGHKHDDNFKKLSAEAALKIFNFVNKGNPITTIDLHGLHVSEAESMVEERLKLLMKQKGSSPLTIITGAGNHSTASGPLIKPAIHKLLASPPYKCLKVDKSTGQTVVSFR